MNKLLSISETPDGFDYPADFIRAFELGSLALEPWRALEGDRVRRRLNGLRDRYPTREISFRLQPARKWWEPVRVYALESSPNRWARESSPAIRSWSRDRHE